MSDFYAQPHDKVQAVLHELETANAELDAAVERWSELEEIQEAFQNAR